MSLPGNGIFVVRGEMSTLMTAMRRGSRWNATAYVDEEKDALMKLFMDLKQVLNRIEDLRLIDPNVFLAPFLEVIRTEETTGAVTSLALSAINKFLSYGLIDPTSLNLAVIIENIADAVTHARFMGTDQSSDGVTLFRVVEVLHTLMRSPEGSVLTNESVCEVMLSCFKICFEPRLNELLRRSAEQALKDMVLLLFMRLPQFADDRTESGLLKKFQMMAASIENDKKQRKKSAVKVQANDSGNWKHSQNLKGSDLTKTGTEEQQQRKISTHSQPGEDVTTLQTHANLNHFKAPPLATTPATPAGNIVDLQGKITQTPTTALTKTETAEITGDTTPVIANNNDSKTPSIKVETASPLLNNPESDIENRAPSPHSQEGSSEYINSVGVRFTQQNSVDGSEGMAPLVPYGLPCIQELFRFLILLCNPLDKQNTDAMMHMGLSLLTVAFEVGADNIGKYDTLLQLAKDDLCRNLFALMNSERLTIFAADLQVCFLLFESLRGHLKFQLEFYLRKLSEIIASDNPKTPYEMRELALDNLLQLWRVPGFVTELYINYDCDLYCSDLFESITNLLSKYTLSATNAIYNTHIIAMDTLISVVDMIELNCAAAKNMNANQSNATAGDAINVTPSSTLRHSRHNSGLDGIVIDDPHNLDDIKVENISKFINTSSRLRLLSGDTAAEKAITREYLKDVKHKKRILSQGTELFNQRPDKGIQFLQEHGILNAQLDPMEVALFLRENPGLDKKMIGEYISRKKNVDSKILLNFVESFDFRGLRVDQALRLYLETFRLPGEAPLIFLVLENFADQWHKQNGEPFANTDAAFSVAYAIIMLNMDQHNLNAKRLNVPMTQEDFLKNLRGLNGGGDYDNELLATIFNAIKNEEIIMPAEQTGLVRENYLWKVLLRRGATTDGAFNYVHDATYDIEIFNAIWGPSLSSLSFMFDKSSDNGYQRTLSGFTKCAAISAFYNLHEDFDALVLTLCKFTTILSSAQQEAATNPALNDIVQAVNFGLNPKAQAAMRTVFALVHDYGDSLRDGWRHIMDIYLQLFRLKLLPKTLMEVEDFCEPSGKAQLHLEKPSQKQESGLFSSLYSYLSSEGQREPTYEEQEFIKLGKKCIKDCQLDQMIQESKFVQLESLQELLRQVLATLKPPYAHKTGATTPYAEDINVFWMEFLVKIVIYNRDRMIPLWPAVHDQMLILLTASSCCDYEYLLNRCVVAILKLAIYLMRNEELCPVVLKSLRMFLMLEPGVILRISKQISIGMYELLKTSAQNIHSEKDWKIVFMILEYVGAGAQQPEYEDCMLAQTNGLTAKSDGALSSEDDSGLPDRGCISDSELAADKQCRPQKIQQQQQPQQNSNTSSPFPSSPTAENWILVNKDTDLTSSSSRPQSPPESIAGVPAISNLIYNCKLQDHSPFALFKCWDSLAFIVRNVAHITPYNFESCVRCIRTFVEACRDGGIRQRRKFDAALLAGAVGGQNQKKKSTSRRNDRSTERSKQQQHDHTGHHFDPAGEHKEDPEDGDLAQRYETLSIQLLDLMYTLYTRTAQIFRWWAEEGCAVPQCSALWAQGWCPLLQGIARLAMDRRREVRTYAISCLQQRALLVHDLQTLSGAEWSSCFQQVLFPLLNELLPDSSAITFLDPVLLEESRIRTATIMSKVFLHHLTPLIDLGEAFSDLWIQILDYIEKFMKVGSDMLSEQMQEILKNMLLVMHSVRVFHSNDGSLHTTLWELTWKRIGEFLPNLKDELFRDEGNRVHVMNQSQTTTSADPNRMPAVAIVPQTSKPQPQQQQQANAAVQSIQSPLLLSPVESPRHSIILQPPETVTMQNPAFILGQVTPLPVIVPQLQQQPTLNTTHIQSTDDLPSTSDDLISQTIEPETNPSNDNPSSLLDQVTTDEQQQATSYNNNTNPTANNNSNTMPLNSTMRVMPIDCNSCSIELFDNPPSPVTNNTTQAEDFVGDSPELQQQSAETGPQKNSMREFLQQQYNQYYENYQQHQLMQNSSQNTSNETFKEEASKNDSSNFNSSILSGDDVSTIAESAQDFKPPAAVLPDDGNKINVPISHLMAGNEYPSFHKRPPMAILQSFTPVYNPNAQQHQQPNQSTNDIYQEYVQNPYNLTLQQNVTTTVNASLVSVEQHQRNLQQLQQQYQQHQQQQQQLPNLVVSPQTLSQNYTAAFNSSPANYFTSIVDPNSIPPGSEMLFGGQS